MTNSRRLAGPVILALSATLAACTPPATPPLDLAAIEGEVRAADEALVAAEAAKDIETALTFRTTDAVVQPANAPMAQGLDAIRAAYEALFAEETGLLEFGATATAIHVASSGDMAWVHGVNRMVFSTPAGPVTDIGKYLTVWVKRDGTWKAAAVALSSDAPRPAPASDTPSM